MKLPFRDVSAAACWVLEANCEGCIGGSKLLKMTLPDVSDAARWGGRRRGGASSLSLLVSPSRLEMKQKFHDFIFALMFIDRVCAVAAF